ncbi:hypothetical protein ACE6H2_019477 [Prunus campanulata]
MSNKPLGHDGLICFLWAVRPLITMISFLRELRHRSPSRRLPPRASSPLAEPSPARPLSLSCRASLSLSASFHVLFILCFLLPPAIYNYLHISSVPIHHGSSIGTSKPFHSPLVPP